MASLCAMIFFWQALFVHGKPIFSARQVTENAKKNSGLQPVGIDPTPVKILTDVYTTGPLPCNVMLLLRDHVQTKRRFFF